MLALREWLLREDPEVERGMEEVIVVFPSRKERREEEREGEGGDEVEGVGGRKSSGRANAFVFRLASFLYIQNPLAQ